MARKNPQDAASRRIVTERLRRFFTDLTAQVASGTAEIWNRAERRRAHEPSRAAGEAPHRTTIPMQNQPVQQQQSKAKPDGET
jgi:hypothetical protein